MQSEKSNGIDTSESPYEEGGYVNVRAKGVGKPIVPPSSCSGVHDKDISEIPYVEEEFTDVNAKGDPPQNTVFDQTQVEESDPLPEYTGIRFRSQNDGSFDFLKGLERLDQAAKEGYGELKTAAVREKQYMGCEKLNTELCNQFTNHQQDIVANTLLARYKSSEKTALHSTPDNNCLFNSVSILLVGDESRSVELRYRCCIYMALNEKIITQSPQFKRFLTLCPDFKDDTIDCAKQGSSSSLIRFIAMSHLLNLEIDDISPGLNGTENDRFKVLNTTLIPPFEDPSRGSITLMWTTEALPTTCPCLGDEWVPNHVVPLVANTHRQYNILMTYRLSELCAKRELTSEPSFASENSCQALNSDVDELIEKRLMRLRI